MYSTDDRATQALCSTAIGTEGSRFLNHPAGACGQEVGETGTGPDHHIDAGRSWSLVSIKISKGNKSFEACGLKTATRPVHG